MEASSTFFLDTMPTMDPFMGHYEQEYGMVSGQQNTAPYHASTPQYAGVPVDTPPPTSHPCRFCPGTSFSSPGDLLDHELIYHLQGEDAFIGQPAALLTPSGYPPINDFSGYEHAGNHFGSSQLGFDGGLDYTDSAYVSGSSPGASHSPTGTTPAGQPAAKRVAKPSTAIKAKVPCPEAGCGKFYVNPQVLRAHIRAKHLGRGVPCTHPGCGKEFHDKAGMRKHVNSVHRKVEYECRYVGCSKKYASKDNLERRHERYCKHRSSGLKVNQ